MGPSLLRKYLHQTAFFLALIACSMLMIKSQGTRVLLANSIYSLSLIGLYCVSGLFHYYAWSQHKYAMMKRIDHAMIFVLIAGTTTPICLLGMPDALGFKLLAMIWPITIIGILIALLWSREPKWVRALFYILLGWSALPYFPQIKAALNPNQLRCLLAGGIAYTVGALIYAFKFPNLYPRIVGYHALFHIFVVIASSCHFWVIYSLTNAYS